MEVIFAVNSNEGSNKYSGTSMGFPFQMLTVIEAIPIKLKIVFVSGIRFEHERSVDFFVKQEVPCFQFMLVDAVCIPVTYFDLVPFLVSNYVSYLASCFASIP